MNDVSMHHDCNFRVLLLFIARKYGVQWWIGKRNWFKMVGVRQERTACERADALTTSFFWAAFFLHLVKYFVSCADCTDSSKFYLFIYVELIYNRVGRLFLSVILHWITRYKAYCMHDSYACNLLCAFYRSLFLFCGELPITYQYSSTTAVVA